MRDLDAAMRRALELAAQHRTHPNPRVGAIVLDREGEVVGEGAHPGPGQPHAERLALDRAGHAARGGTLVVTLEPCDHTGRTPPCSAAVLASGVSRVLVGMEDPDPRVRGAGVARLRRNGIDVQLWEHPEEVEQIDPAYFHHRRIGRPRLTLKAGLTLDGQVAAADGTSQWITGEEAREDAHRLRAGVDAVLVGAGTLRADNPRLDARLPGYLGPQPRPVVVAGSRPLPAGSRLWERHPVVLAPGPVRVPAGELVEVPGPAGQVDLEKGVSALGEMGYLDLLVEGGPGLAAALWREGLIDRGVFYFGAVMAGGVGRSAFDATFATLGDARQVEIVDTDRLGIDLRVEWRVKGVHRNR